MPPDIRCTKTADTQFTAITTKAHLNIKCGNDSFRVNVSNHWRVKAFFNTALQWFFDETKNDMFVYDKNNDLIFNSEYKNLTKTIYSGTDTNSWLRVYPIVVRDSKGTPSEGVVIFINSQNSFAEIPLDKFGAMTDVINKYDFDREVLMFTQLMKLSVTASKDDGCDLSLSNAINNEAMYETSYSLQQSPFFGGKK